MKTEFNYKFGEFTTRVTVRPDFHNAFAGADLVVFDENTFPIFSDKPTNYLVIPPGEENKTWSTVDAILTRALELGLARDSVIMGVGGGVLCDMTAFAASLYMRGCQLILAPTTILAMVDAGLGGKTGIDYHSYKNMIGTFYPAQELRVFTQAVKTLPRREVLGGLAEAIKAGLLGDMALFELLEKRREAVLALDPQVLTEILARSIEVKGGVVQRDFKENGERAFLNLGHTFAHALESVSGFTAWSHGEAVSWGMAKALELGQRLGLTPAAYVKRVRDLLTAYGYRLTAAGFAATDILAAMKKDKKKKAGKVRFVLQKGFQQTLLQEVADADVLAVLEEGVQ